MERSDRIPLLPEESRCDPATPGRAASRCARRLASVPQGSPMSDFTQTPGGACTALCAWYLDIGSMAHQQRPPPPKATKPWPGSTR